MAIFPYRLERKGDIEMLGWLGSGRVLQIGLSCAQ